jgi:hypothetical protein
MGPQVVFADKPGSRQLFPLAGAGYTARETRPARPAGSRQKPFLLILAVKNPFNICYLQTRCGD